VVSHASDNDLAVGPLILVGWNVTYYYLDYMGLRAGRGFPGPRDGQMCTADSVGLPPKRARTAAIYGALHAKSSIGSTPHPRLD
jgi:hypothetical protein